MASIKIKFRASIKNDKQGTIYYQIIQNRIIRQYRTNYQIYPNEWNNQTSSIVIADNSARFDYLSAIKKRITTDMNGFWLIICELNYKRANYSADDIISIFRQRKNENSFFKFMQKTINQLQLLGRYGTYETYTTTLNSFKRFRQNSDVTFELFDSDLIMSYECYLKHNNISMNSISFYMRILRAVYNRAVEKKITEQKYPFKHVYTGIDKTVKRAISLKAIKKIKDLDLSKRPSLNFAKDLFLFSFYTRGMSFVDIAYLKKKDLNMGVLSYRRRKTQQQLFIKWEKCMQDIVDKYNVKDSPYLFPIIKYTVKNEREQYINKRHFINNKLKIIGEKSGLSIPLTMYVARHTWASIAKSKKIPLSVISESMGHDSEKTTKIYLAALDTIEIDKANNLIINSI